MSFAAPPHHHHHSHGGGGGYRRGWGPDWGPTTTQFICPVVGKDGAVVSSVPCPEPATIDLRTLSGIDFKSSTPWLVGAGAVLAVGAVVGWAWKAQRRRRRRR